MVQSIEQQRRTWGNAIRKARKEKGWTQEELAHEWGNTLSYVQKIETGQKGNAETCRDLLALIATLKKAS